jgi:DNA-binding IclR family transcriptional regulator
MGLLKIARPVLEETCEKCNEKVLLGVVRADRVVYVDMVESTRAVRVASRVGMDLPVYCSAVGKVQVAYESSDEVERIFSELPIERYTPRTITDRDEFFRHLDQVRQQGYALDDEEFEEGIRCAGAPVRDYTGRVVAGVSISGPAYRLTDGRLHSELIPLVREAGSKISAKLGYDV